MLEVLQVELLAANESKDAARCANHNVWAVGLEDLLILADGQAAKEDGNLKEERVTF